MAGAWDEYEVVVADLPAARRRWRWLRTLAAGVITDGGVSTEPVREVRITRRRDGAVLLEEPALGVHTAELLLEDWRQLDAEAFGARWVPE